MYRDNMEELRMKKKKEKVKRKNDSPLDFSNKKKKKGNNRERISLAGLISRSLTFERNSTQSR